MSSYQIYEFRGVELPLYNPEADLGTGKTDSTLRASIGGAFDVYGLRQRLPTTVTFGVQGIYAVSEDEVLLVDHTGTGIVTETAAPIRAATEANFLRWQVDALKKQIGQRGDVKRRRWDDTTVIQWKLARLLSVGEKSAAKQRTQYAELECTFETAQAAWRSAAASTYDGYMPGGGACLVPVWNDGNMPVEDVIITITAGLNVTSVQIVCAEIGVDLRWVGTLTTTQHLVIDCGTSSVNKTDGPAYSGFSLGAGHTARGWLPLAYGMNVFTVTTDATSTVQFSHYDQWA